LLSENLKFASEVGVSASESVCDSQDSRRHFIVSLTGNWPPLKLKFALAGNDILRCPTLDGAYIQRCKTRRKEGMLLFGKQRAVFFNCSRETGRSVNC
jgi:hypothetical protein